MRADPLPDTASVTVYDPDPKHLWNRLHEALYVWLEGEGPHDPGELDAFLWQDNPYRDKGERYKRAVAVLDEFVAKRGDKLVGDPRKRALLQRDLWVLFDTVASFRGRAVKILLRLALTADQIKALPDNFAEAVAAKKFPDWVEAGRLWDADGPWVLLSSKEEAPLARSHVEFFGGRSAFFVFLRLPAGREQTRKYVAELRSSGIAPKIPGGGGAYFALVRQMLLIDDRGRIALTPVIETLQIRGAGDHEFKLSREDFTAGKPSLTALGPEEKTRDFIARLGRNVGNGRSQVLGTCNSCHRPDTMQSYVRHFPPSQLISPSMSVSNRNEEALRIQIWKKGRYERGLLQGLTLTPSRE
jgi:hypothetical protein